MDKEIIISPNAFHAPKPMMVPEGVSIRQIIQQCNPEYPESLIVEINGKPITRDKWGIKPNVDDHVLIYSPVMGGGGGKKNPLRIILSIVVIVVAAYTQQWWITKGLAGGAVGGAAAGAVVASAGMLLVDAIAPIRMSTPNNSQPSYSDSPTYSIAGGSNRANPWGAVPLNLGINKAYPPLGSGSYTEIIDTVVTKQKYMTPALPTYAPGLAYIYKQMPNNGYYVTYTETIGSDEYFRMLVVWGYGPLDISNIKIGDTLLSSYSDYEIQTREGWSTDTPITLFPSQVNQESAGVGGGAVELTQSGGIIVRTAPDANCDELSVDLSFPNGLVTINNDGSYSTRSVTVLIQYREVGAGSWTTHETKVFTDKTTLAVRYGTSWDVDNTKEYEIGITRQTADSTDDQIIDDVYWINLRSVTCDNPINAPYPVAATAIKIKATDQLNSYIDTLNATVSSYVPVWDNVLEEWGTDEVDYEISQNCAALYRWALTCPANARARTASQIDDAGLGEWYEFCVTNGYKFNIYKDTQSSVWETLADIAAAGRASPAIIEGLWTVTIDTGSQALVQHITPRNSWGFSSEKVLFDPPHAFRIRFVNEDNDYKWDERIVYDDGYNSGNATLFESITLIGITDPDLIWKFGRFHIAQARLRPEVYTLNMDFEHLVCNRGSKVRVSHDVPLWGVGSGRVKTLIVNGPETHITHVVLDEYVTMEAGNTYVCRFRLASGSTLIENIVLDVGETNTLEFETPVLIASGPAVGDLAMFGITDLETVELLVQSITRSTDLTAQLRLVDFAEAIYNADTGEIPAFDPAMTAPTDVTRIPPDPPTIDTVSTGTDVTTISGGGSVSTINVYLLAPADHIKIRGYRIRFRLVGETVWTYTAESKSLTVPVYPVSDQQSYEIQAQSISVYGQESQWTSIETGSSDMPQIIPGSATNISVTQMSPGSEFNLASVKITFTLPSPLGVYAYTEIYGCTDDATYQYMGRSSTGEFIFNGLGSLYKIGETLYIRVRSVSKYEVRETLPGSYDDSLVIQSVAKISSFNFGLYDFWGGNENLSHADTKIVLGGLNDTPKIALGTSADSLTLLNADTYPGYYADGDGNLRAGGATHGIKFDQSTGIFSVDPKLRVGDSATYIEIDGANTRITSNDYVSGAMGAGFLVSPEQAEFGNIAARGIIRTSVFEYNSISVHSGSHLVAMGGDVLAEDMTADEDGGFYLVKEDGDKLLKEDGDGILLNGYVPLKIEGNDTFAVGDILEAKEGTDDEYMRVQSISDAPMYYVVRDIKGDYATDSNPAWPKGTSIVNHGPSGKGGIYTTASDTNAPHQSVYIHTGEPWNKTTLIRQGNLNGYAGYITDTYGWASYIDANNYIKIDATNGIQMSGNITIIGGLDNVADGSIYGRVQLAQLDSGYLYLMRRNADQTERIEITTSGVEQYTNGVKMIELASGALYLGDQSNEYLKASSSGVQIYDGASLLATYTPSAITLGLTTAEHININTSGITIYDGTSLLSSFTTAIITLGDPDNEHTEISASGFEVKDGTTSLASISSAAARVGIASAGYLNTNITSTAVQFRNNTTVQAYIDAYGFRSDIQPAFKATLSGGANNVTGDGTIVSPLIFGSEEFDQGSDYNTSTGYFTAPAAGRYLFACCLLVSGWTSAHTLGIVEIYIDATTYTFDSLFNPYYASNGETVSYRTTFGVFELAQGETACIVVRVDGGTKVIDFTSSSHFSGYMLG